MDRLVAVVEALRDHCPWTAALTHGDLAEYLVKEAYEAVAEIEARDPAAWADVPARRADGAYPALAAELGDVLFQVVLHAAVSRPPGTPVSSAGFRVADAADAGVGGGPSRLPRGLSRNLSQPALRARLAVRGLRTRRVVSATLRGLVCGRARLLCLA